MKNFFFGTYKKWLGVNIVALIISFLVTISFPIHSFFFNSTIHAQMSKTEPNPIHEMLLSQVGIGISEVHPNNQVDIKTGFIKQIQILLSEDGNSGLAFSEKELIETEAKFIEHALNHQNIHEDTLVYALITLKYDMLGISFNSNRIFNGGSIREVLDSLQNSNPFFNDWTHQYKQEVINSRSKAFASLNTITIWYENYIWQLRNKSYLLSVFMDSWSKQMNQNYVKINSDFYNILGHHHNPTPVIANVFKNSTIQGNPVKWSVTDEAQIYDPVYVILDVYQQVNVTDGHLYIFATLNGDGIVLHSKGTIDSSNLNFTPTENVMLADGFSSIVNDIMELKENKIVLVDSNPITENNDSENYEHKFNPISEPIPKNVVGEYGKKVGKIFYPATPATNIAIENISVPDDLLNNLLVNGKEVLTKFFGLQGGQGDSVLEILEIFVAPESRDIILFTKYDGAKKVLLNMNPVTSDEKINFVEIDDEILNQWE